MQLDIARDTRRAPGAPRQRAEVTATAKKAERIGVQPDELDAMSALTELVGRSPRALTRFVNVYRLIKADLRAGERRSFVRRGTGLSNARRVLFLLAVDTGLPSVAPAFFAALQQANETHNESDKGAAPDLSWIVAHMESDENLRDHEEWRRFKEWLQQSGSRYIPDLGAEATHLVVWLPRIVRHGFHVVAAS